MVLAQPKVSVLALTVHSSLPLDVMLHPWTGLESSGTGMNRRGGIWNNVLGAARRRGARFEDPWIRVPEPIAL